MLFVVPDGTPSDAEAIADAMSAQGEVTVSAALIESYGEALRALCDGTASVVSLNAFAYLAAREESCGTPIYVLERNGDTFTQGQLVARDVFAPQFFRGAYCRLDAESLHTWVIPRLFLLARGVDPAVNFASIVDTESDRATVEAILDLSCGLGATSLGAEADLQDIPGIDRLQVLQELPAVPNDLIVLSSHLDAFTQALLADLLRGQRDELAALFDADTLQEPDDAMFDDLVALLVAAGVEIGSLPR